MSDSVTRLNGSGPPADFNKYFTETKAKLTLAKKRVFYLENRNSIIIILYIYQ